jgi:hypothetical protein
MSSTAHNSEILFMFLPPLVFYPPKPLDMQPPTAANPGLYSAHPPGIVFQQYKTNTQGPASRLGQQLSHVGNKNIKRQTTTKR